MIIYRFTIVSDEVDNFGMEIQIDAEATFLDLQNAMLDALKYKKDTFTSFFTCDEDWQKREEITMEAVDSADSAYDNWVMGETRLNELLKDEKDKLIFVFDQLTDRCLFIELSEIITGKTLKKAKCTRLEGQAPPQSIDFEAFEKKITQKSAVDDVFDDDLEFADGYDPDDIEGLNNFDGNYDNNDIY